MENSNEIVEMTPEQKKEMRREKNRQAKRDWYARNRDKVLAEYYKSKGVDYYLKKTEKVMRAITA